MSELSHPKIWLYPSIESGKESSKGGFEKEMKHKEKAKHKVSGFEARMLSLPPNYTAQHDAPRGKKKLSNGG